MIYLMMIQVVLMISYQLLPKIFYHPFHIYLGNVSVIIIILMIVLLILVLVLLELEAVEVLGIMVMVKLRNDLPNHLLLLLWLNH